MFFRPAGAILLWIPQFAMAVEAWRQVAGPAIGQWMAAVGEFEALCSLGAYAFERPEQTFPELLDRDGSLVRCRRFEASLDSRAGGRRE